MPFYRRRRAARRAKRYARKMVSRGLRIGGMRMIRTGFRPFKNYYKFKRYGLDCQIANTTNGVVNMNTSASGWSLTGASIDINNTYQFGGAMQFQLDQCLEHADFNLLFDRYKITGVKVTLIPLGTYSASSSSGATNFTNFPTIAIAVDNDDASLPTSWNNVAVKQDCRIQKLNKPISVYIHKPKIASAVYNGATTAYTQKTGFIDMNNDNVPHYGLKFWIRECDLPNVPGSVVGANSLFRVVTKFYLALKDPQ